MQGTFFFVHGTGVRQARYDELWAIIRQRAAANGITGVEFVGCLWGNHYGVELDRIAVTLPPDAQTRAAFDGAPTDADLEVALWALLLEDPLFELRLAGEAQGPPPGITVGDINRGEAAAAALRSLKPDAARIADSGLSGDEVVAAAGVIADSPELAAAATAAPQFADAELLAAIARAIVATALARRRATTDEPPLAAVDREARTALIEEVVTAFAPAGTRGFGDWIKKRATAFAAKRATTFALNRRSALMTGSIPGLGDILHYQRRGNEMANFVAGAMAKLKPPVVAVGHSLGGIMLVDLLTRETPPPADLLVTVGSQSPVLYAIDSLERLRPNQKQPQPFAPWLNVYDRNDLLSFCAEATFPGVGRITDHAVDSGVPFPEAHSAYWRNDRVYELIRDAWP